MSVSVTTLLSPCVCASCGVTFGLDSEHELKLRQSHAQFYCPNGHFLVFGGKTEAEKERDRLKEQLRLTDNVLLSTRQSLEHMGARASYGAGSIAKCVLALLDTWHRQGHSGESASLTLYIFDRLVNHKVLSPLTTETGEWMDMSEYQGGEPLWQNRRQPSCFSLDAGKTYYDVNEFRPRWRLWLGRLGIGYHGFTFHESKSAHDVSGRA
jgi:hypothetical protein